MLEQCLHLSEITGHKGTYKDAHLQNLNNVNPTSRDHIAWILKTHENWKTDTDDSDREARRGRDCIKGYWVGDSPVVSSMSRYYQEIGDDLGRRERMAEAILRRLTELHHHCSVATNTFRCAHRKPNLAQVPSDKRFRKLFQATPTKVLVSADLSGIELRMLAHYLARYDKGRYAEILTTGDIHQTNADRIGITRRQVKTVTYAFLYGAGNVKLGRSFDKLLSEESAARKGADIRKAYVAAIPGLAELLQACQACSKRGYANAIDGRRISVDKGHKFSQLPLTGISSDNRQKMDGHHK